MFLLNGEKKCLEVIQGTNFKDEEIYERYDLQETLIKSWEIFTSNIGLPGIIYIDKEFIPHNDVKNRIDILAFEDISDKNDEVSKLNIIIFELKRGTDKNQLIQAISYAGMVYTWEQEDIIKIIENKNINNDDINNLLEGLKNNKYTIDIKIVLVAETFEPEVIFSSNWLNNMGIDIKAFAINTYKLDDKLLLNIEQRFPLKELSDAYKKRIKEKNNNFQELNWNEIEKNLNYDWGKSIIKELTEKYSNNPNRKRIFIKTKEPFKSIIFYFTNNYIKIVTVVKDKKEGMETITSIFDDSFEINEWRDGLSFKIENEQTYRKLAEWLGKKE